MLKAEKASAKEKQKENERQRDKVKEAMAEEKIKQRAASKVKKTASSSSVESTSSARQSRPKTKFEETLSIEELFDDDVGGLFFENSVDFIYLLSYFCYC